MSKSATPAEKLSKAAFHDRKLTLRTELPLAQRDLAAARARAVVLVIAGADGAGKSRVAQSLLAWLDPHDVTTTAFDPDTPHDAEMPAMWRYWCALPAKGQVSLLFGSWYHRPLRDRIAGQTSQADFLETLARIARFEAMLAHEDVCVCKLWLDLPRDIQKQRLKAAGDADPGTDVRLREWRGLSKADRGRWDGAVDTMIQTTSTAASPWTRIAAEDARFRDTESGRVLLEALHPPAKTPPAEPQPPEDAAAEVAPAPPRGPAVLDSLDLGARADKAAYQERLHTLQHRLYKLTQARRFREHGMVAVFEGPDAAGKGGCIRRTVRALDPRLYRVHAIAAPSDEELAHPYLWRFWRRVPPRGTLGVFDRSWYGRVLVERVEGLCSEANWKRAYREIVDFETDLAESGLIVVKFWLQISKDEQLRRFKDREETPFKRFKITPEDWRNRANWDAHQEAAEAMIARTDTETAPWTLVAAEDKRHARLRVLETLCARLEAV